MTRATRSALLALSLVTAGAAYAKDESDGEALAWKYHCMTCHGRTGVASSDHYPNLAGQNPVYLEGRLRYFREGIEPGNRMNGHAAPLSDEQIRILATYFNRPNAER